MRSVWFLLIFPTAYFLHVGYSEALFLALALGSILAARGERWWLAGVLGAFCWMTRDVWRRSRSTYCWRGTERPADSIGSDAGL